GVDVKNPVPACAVTCEQKAPTGDCPTDDSQESGKCLCENKDYIQSIVDCSKESCNDQDLKTAEFVGEALCRAY
ncbi:hypothetical protein FRC05_003555, partial [Tulasnella sp. 425]